MPAFTVLILTLREHGWIPARHINKAHWEHLIPNRNLAPRKNVEKRDKEHGLITFQFFHFSAHKITFESTSPEMAQ